MQLCILHQLHGELGCTIVPQINSYLLSELPCWGFELRSSDPQAVVLPTELPCLLLFLFYPFIFSRPFHGHPFRQHPNFEEQAPILLGTQSKARWFCCKKNNYFCRQQHYSELDFWGLFLIITFFRKSCSWRQLDCLSHPFIAF